MRSLVNSFEKKSLIKFTGNRSRGEQKNVRYKITRYQYENQSRFDFLRILVSSQKFYTGLPIEF